LNIPVGGHRRIEFAAAPGTYEIVCIIHEQGGMKGTLVVK
jgi:plastocyanin